VQTAERHGEEHAGEHQEARGELRRAKDRNEQDLRDE
jgi:hypothetical protein